MQPTRPAAAQTLFTLSIVFYAMIAGVVIFGAVAVFVLRPEPGDRDPTVFLTMLSVVALNLAVAWVVVGRVQRRGLRARLAQAPRDEAPTVIDRGFFSTKLVGGAIGEAFCFFALVVYVLTAAPMALVAAAVGLLALLAQVPSANRFHRFAQEIKGHRPS